LDLLVKLDKPVESLVWQWPAGSVPLQDTGNQVWKGTIEVGDTGGNYDLVAVVKNLPKPIILSGGSVQLKTDRKPDVNYLDMASNEMLKSRTGEAVQKEFLVEQFEFAEVFFYSMLDGNRI
jgi:hypothetical protein